MYKSNFHTNYNYSRLAKPVLVGGEFTYDYQNAIEYWQEICFRFIDKFNIH